MNNIVIYHKNCLDGTCAAWVASQYLGENTTYIPVEYGKDLTDQFSELGKEIVPKLSALYILDWCPEMADLDKCTNRFGKVVLIDHHESAIKKLHDWKIAKGYQTGIPNNLELFLALNNEWSGAMGTAIWFADRCADYPDKDILVDHWLVKAVDDRDRWQFKYPDTKMINEGLFNIGFDLQSWQNMNMTEDTKTALIITGDILVGKRNKEVQQIIESSAIIDDNAERIVFCNCPYHLASEVGNVLAKDYRMAVLWFINKEGQISVSLRSNSNTKDWINCSKIAIELNGGGHANAAGFKMNASFEDIVMVLDDAIIDTEQNITEFPF